MLYDCMNPVLHNIGHIVRFEVLVVVNLRVTVFYQKTVNSL